MCYCYRPSGFLERKQRQASGKTGDKLGKRFDRNEETGFPDGARFIELAAIGDPVLVIPTIRQALNVPESGTGGPKSEGRDVRDYLRDKTMLLVLDNFEQVLSAASFVADLLAAGPNLTILVTSRAPLHVYGEHQFPVEPLALPDLARLPAPSELSQLPSVALFVARAQAVQPQFGLTSANRSAVAALCVRLDGLPLAIELAAPQIKHYSPVELAAHLDRPLDTLTGGAQNLPARQRTLRNAIEWSYGLLEPDEQRWFARLGVFTGGFDAAAAQAVCPEDTSAANGRQLESLLDRSLIQPAKGASERSRFTLLDTLREYALDRLAASGGEQAIRRRHADYFLNLSEEVAPRLITTDQRHWFKRVEAEHDNFRAALGWLLDPASEAEPDAERIWRAEAALRMCVNLFRFWRYRCDLSEGHRWTTGALGVDRPPASASRAGLRAEAYWASAMFSGMLGRDDEAREQLAEGLRLSQAVDDRGGVAKALTGLGWLAHKRGETGRAVELQTRAVELLEAIGDDFTLTYAYAALGATLRSADDNERARRCFEQARDISRRIDHARGAAVALVSLGGIALDAGQTAEAFDAFRAALAGFIEIDDRVNIATCLSGVSGTLADVDVATRLLGFADRQLQTTGGQLQKADRRMHDREVERCRAALRPADFDTSWLEGGALSLDQAVEIALHPQRLHALAPDASTDKADPEGGPSGEAGHD